jgi:2-methylcitrate dehydratase PrpD
MLRTSVSGGDYMKTLVERLANFSLGLRFDDIPKDVVHESKRILLDSIGCALAGLSVDKGKIVVQLAKEMGGPPESTIIGAGDRVSTFGAAFANGELIYALDYDVVTAPPGHVTPFVIPASLAIGEKRGSSGKGLICSLVVAHEVSTRFGFAMGYYRDIRPGEKVSFPPVTGFSSSIFGGTLAASLLQGLSSRKLSHALGLAGHIAPAQGVSKVVRTLPATFDKGTMAGWISQAELLSVFLSERGYTGDVEVLEGDYGFWRYMGSSKWNPEILTDRLGEEWKMLKTTIYKPYPQCRISHTVLDCLYHLIEKNQLQPEEIEGVTAYCDPHGAVLPMWSNKDIRSFADAQMSVPYAVSVAAHRVKIGPEWQDLETIGNERILSFMDKVRVEAHPEFEKILQEDPDSRVGKVEINARGKRFTEERRYRKGSPATGESRMTDRELVEKFKHNAARVWTHEKIEKLPDLVFRLEDMDDISHLMPMR